eukprot:2084438-Amphidinium_carterae.1
MDCLCLRVRLPVNSGSCKEKGQLQKALTAALEGVPAVGMKTVQVAGIHPVQHLAICNWASTTSHFHEVLVAICHVVYMFLPRGLH